MGRGWIAVLFLPALVLATLPLRAEDAPSLAQRYAAIYLSINTAEQAERHGDYAGAVQGFKDCYVKLLEIRQSDPDWHTALVLHRLADAKAKILELQPRADAKAVAPAGGATNAPPAAVTNLPPGLPPEVRAFQEALPRLEQEQKEKPLAPVGSSPEVKTFFEAHPHNEAAPHLNFAWHANVTAGEFWIGENGDKASAWAADWVRENGGVDNPNRRNGYATAEHASRVDPFYVALPFDDLKHPDLAQTWLPNGWARPPKKGKAVSSCKDRWVELKNGRGDVCYAQWEDAGPGADAQPEYVFGDKGPKDAAKPAIDLSPAVAEYLGMTDAAAKVVSWRFVDEADVRPGAWMKLDEQAVIYLAMHGQ